MTDYPHRIIAPTRDEPRRSRNCLRIDYISDGTIAPRCNLKPLDERAVWLIENRPYHLADHATFFGHCAGGAPSCDACPVYQRTLYRSAPIRVYKTRFGFEVTTLGRCTWYTLYTGHDINEAASWVKKRGGALGARGEDARGRYREGFVNWYRLPESLRPD